MLLVALGDTHIPGRAVEIPLPILEFLRDKRPDAILFTGDATEQDTLLLLERMAPLYTVRGNMDNVEAPREQRLEFKGKRLLLIHGHQFGRGNYTALVEYARGFDLLVCGHTHRQETFRREGMLVVNPGSATGAWGRIATGEKSFTTIVINGGVEVTEYVVKGDGIQSKRPEGKDEA